MTSNETNNKKTTQMENKKETAKVSIYDTIKKLTILMAFFTPILYLLGYQYTNGYLSEYGLNNEYFPRAFDYYLVQGYNTLLLGMGAIASGMIANYKIALSLFTFIFLAVIVVLIYYRYEAKIIKKQIRFQVWAKTNKYFENTFLAILIPIAGITISVLAPIFLFMLLFTPYLSYFQGIDIAKNEIAHFQGCKLSEIDNNQNCVHVLKDGEVVSKGKLIAMSSNYIALWNEGEPIVYPLNEVLITVKYGKKSLKEITNINKKSLHE